MPSNESRKYNRVVSYIEDIIGADVNRDLLRVAMVADDLGGLTVDIGDIGGEPQSAIDVAYQIDRIQDIITGGTVTVTDDGSLTISGVTSIQEDTPLDVSASEVDVDLASQTIGTLTVTDNGSLNVSGVTSVQEDAPMDVSAAEVDVNLSTQTVSPITVTDNGSFNVAGVASVQEDTPLDVSASEVDVDLNSQTASPITITDDGNLAISAWNAGILTVSQDSAIDISSDISRSLGRVRFYDSDIVTATATSTGLSNAAQVDLGRNRKEVDIFYDVSGSATITVEVSTDGSAWRELQTISPDSAGTDIIQVSTSFRYARAYADQNLKTIEMSSKGV